MKNDNIKTYSKENALRNTSKTQNQHTKTSFNTTIEEPALNSSGVDAKKRGF